jgi:hypothetical protein
MDNFSRSGWKKMGREPRPSVDSGGGEREWKCGGRRRG